MSPPTNISPREPYEAPAVEDVPVKPEEQQFAACKGDGFQSGNFTGPTCKTNLGGPCRNS
jgi:hypothetical protein